MKKIKKYITVFSAVSLLALGLGSFAQAATYYSYKGWVQVIEDFQTSPQTKKTTGSAYVNVTSIGSGTLVYWVEDSSGNNVTNKVSSSTTGKITLDYKSASKQKGKKLHLNISTSLKTWNKVYTEGKWTPN